LIAEAFVPLLQSAEVVRIILVVVFFGRNVFKEVVESDIIIIINSYTAGS
jgi:hypothetical protein